MSGRSGGERGLLRRLPPLPGLDAEQRVQADAGDLGFRPADEDHLRANHLAPPSYGFYLALLGPL